MEKVNFWKRPLTKGDFWIPIIVLNGLVFLIYGVVWIYIVYEKRKSEKSKSKDKEH